MSIHMSDACPTYIKGFHDENIFNGMIYNPLGKTDMKVSMLSIGSAQLGLVHNTPKEDEAIATVREAIKRGINYIDVAPWYGFGTAEIVLGKALKGIPRKAYYLATKVGRYKPHCQDMFDFSSLKTIQSVDESLSKLGVDYIDVIQVHDLEFAPSIDIILNETLPALQKVKDMGKARYIGITGYPLSKLCSTIDQSKIPIDTVLSYCRCTLFDQTLLKYLDYFKEKGIGVINAAFLGMGLLTPGTLPSWHPAQQEIKDACEKALNYCKSQNVNISKLATHFALSQQGISTHLVGMTDIEVLETNMNTMKNGLTKEEVEVLTHIRERFFDPLPIKHWENIEVEKYWRKINDLKATNS